MNSSDPDPGRKSLALAPTPFISPRNVPLWMSLLAAALFAALIAWPR
jgi:hypothetical protein